VFIDLERAYDRVPRKLGVNNKGVQKTNINVMEDIYDGSKVHVKKQRILEYE